MSFRRDALVGGCNSPSKMAKRWAFSRGLLSVSINRSNSGWADGSGMESVASSTRQAILRRQQDGTRWYNANIRTRAVSQRASVWKQPAQKLKYFNHCSLCFQQHQITISYTNTFQDIRLFYKKEVFWDLKLCCWVCSAWEILLGLCDPDCEGIMILHNGANHLATKCHILDHLYLQRQCQHSYRTANTSLMTSHSILSIITLFTCDSSHF